MLEIGPSERSREPSRAIASKVQAPKAEPPLSRFLKTGEVFHPRFQAKNERIQNVKTYGDTVGNWINSYHAICRRLEKIAYRHVNDLNDHMIAMESDPALRADPVIFGNNLELRRLMLDIERTIQHLPDIERVSSLGDLREPHAHLKETIEQTRALVQANYERIEELIEELDVSFEEPAPLQSTDYVDRSAARLEERMEQASENFESYRQAVELGLVLPLSGQATPTKEKSGKSKEQGEQVLTKNTRLVSRLDRSSLKEVRAALVQALGAVQRATQRANVHQSMRRLDRVTNRKSQRRFRKHEKAEHRAIRIARRLERLKATIEKRERIDKQEQAELDALYEVFDQLQQDAQTETKQVIGELIRLHRVIRLLANERGILAQRLSLPMQAWLEEYLQSMALSTDTEPAIPTCAVELKTGEQLIRDAQALVHKLEKGAQRTRSSDLSALMTLEHEGLTRAVRAMRKQLKGVAGTGDLRKELKAVQQRRWSKKWTPKQNWNSYCGRMELMKRAAKECHRLSQARPDDPDLALIDEALKITLADYRHLERALTRELLPNK